MRVDQQAMLTEQAAAAQEDSAVKEGATDTSSSKAHSTTAGGSEKLEVVEDAGVRKADAMTQTWSKSSLRTVYAFFWLTYATNAFQSSITYNVSAYVTSDFEEHSLIPVIGIVSNVMTAAAYLVMAKVLNLWDRSYGYVAMATLATLGLILSATCTNIATYCVSQVFYNVGFVGIIFSIDVLTADTSRLKDRGLAFAFTASPYIITAYAGPKISEKFVETNWRWAFGAFAIILPFVALPLFGFLQINTRRAAKLMPEITAKSGRTFFQSVWWYLIEFDVIGVFLICAGLVIFLLPFSIASTYAESFASPTIISMIVVGVVCIAAFVVYEKYFSPKPFIPWRLLSDRTVLGANILNFSWQIAYYCWASYFSSYLQVVYDLSISRSGYIGSIYDVVATFMLLPVGLAIRKTGHFKWILFISLPLYTLGEGLMIYFRQPGRSIGFIVMTQIFIAIGGSSFTLVEQVAVLSVGSHNDSAAMLALLGMFGYIGGAVGNAVSGAIWTNTLPAALQANLPAETLADWETIYDSLDVQLSYPIGDATRTAIQMAYATAQTRMLIGGTAILGLATVGILMMRNIKVSEIEQVRGVLF